MTNNVPTTATVDETGQQVLGAPDLTFSVAANYRQGLGTLGSLVFDGNFSYSSYFKVAPGDGNYDRPYGLLDSSLTYVDPSNRYRIELWGRNMTNVEVVGRYTTALTYSLATRFPASYGVTLSASF